MGKPNFRGRIERALAAGSLDLEFTHVGDFSDRDRELTVRVNRRRRRLLDLHVPGN